MIVGMPAAGPEAHLLDGEAVSVKPLSRALGFLLQEPVLCKETLFVICFGSFFSNASPRPTICRQSKLRDTFQEEPGMGEVMGVKSECQHFSCPSAFRVASVSLLCLAQLSSVTYKMG